MALLKKPEDIDLSVREDARLLDAGLSEKQLEEILERAHRDIEKMVGERNYWLIRIGRFLELLDEELRLKRIEILATDDESVITSDHPVARSDNAGVRNSNLFFPIGKRRILAFTDRSAQRMSGPMKIDVKRIPGSLAREINKATIGHAEQFILGSVKRPPIKILFDRTSPPTRMMPNSGVR